MNCSVPPYYKKGFMFVFDECARACVCMCDVCVWAVAAEGA